MGKILLNKDKYILKVLKSTKFAELRLHKTIQKYKKQVNNCVYICTVKDNIVKLEASTAVRISSWLFIFFNH